MNKKGIVFLLLCVTCSVSAAPEGALMRSAKSLLRPQKFPKVFKDLPFHERVAILAEGFDAMESVYDSNGVCISGCAYEGITIEEEKEIIAQATEDFNEAMADGSVLASSITQGGVNDFVGGGGPEEIEVIEERPDVGDLGSDVVGSLPAPEQNACRAAVPNFGPPVRNPLMVHSDFGHRPSTNTFHRGIDLKTVIFNDKDILAMADGIVSKNAFQDGGCGNYVNIDHVLGVNQNIHVMTQYCHMERPSSFSVGQHVKKGDVIGKAGNTGRSGGEHLHLSVRYKIGGKWIPIDPLGGRKEPKVDSNEAYNFDDHKGKNFLSKNYCVVSWVYNGVSSARMKSYDNNEKGLINDFPCCDGWCTSDREPKVKD